MNTKTSAGLSFLKTTWDMLKKVLTLIQTGRFSHLWNQLSYRLYSTSLSFGLHRELHQPFTPRPASKIATQASKMDGIRRVITFVSAGNIPSLKGCKRAGFSPYMLKKDRRFLFQHKVSFHPIPDEMLAKYHESTGGKTSNRAK